MACSTLMAEKVQQIIFRGSQREEFNVLYKLDI